MMPDVVNDRVKLSNTEIEAYLIGTVIMYPGVFEKVAELSPDVFTDGFYAEVWRAMKSAKAEDANAILAPSIIAARMQTDDVKAVARTIEGLPGMTAMSAEGYAKHLTDLAARRSLWERGREMLSSATDLDRPVESAVAEAMAGLRGEAGKTWRQGASKRQVWKNIAARLREALPCYPTGLPGFDASLGGGLYAGKVIGVGGRMKEGKTVLAATISHNLNNIGVDHLFMTHEMTDEEIEQRNAARVLGINSIHFLRRDMPDLADRVEAAADTIPNHAVFANMQGSDLNDVLATIARAVVRKGIKGAILDYLQLVDGRQRDETEEQHTRKVAQALAHVAKREGIFILLTAQLNQDKNVRGGEGLKIACDAFYKLHRHVDDGDHLRDPNNAWLEHELSRYTMTENVGSEDRAGLTLDPRNGPSFIDPYHEIDERTGLAI